MSGSHRFLLDTNAIVSLLASVISYLEFLAFDGLSASDRTCFASFCARIEIVVLSHEERTLIDQILDLRNHYRLKLPDAIIGATALSRNALLITSDSHFSGVSLLSVQGC